MYDYSYSYSSGDAEASIAVLGSMLIISLVIGLIFYIFESVGLYTLAKRRGHPQSRPGLGAGRPGLGHGGLFPTNTPCGWGSIRGTGGSSPFWVPWLPFWRF